MAGKSFKDYAALWTQNRQEETEGDDKQAHNKKNKQAHEKEVIQAHVKEIKQAPAKTSAEPEPIAAQGGNKEAQDNLNTMTPDKSFNQGKQAPIKRKRGRPRMDAEIKKQHFNLLLKPATIKGLYLIAGRIQAETGKRVTATGLICGLVDQFVKEQLGDGTDGGPDQH